MQQKPFGYAPSLDGLRAIAVLLVMLVHAHFFLGHNGQIGVSVFFTLSGFLITTLLMEEYDKRNDISLKGFYIRRTMRLFPALYLLIGAILIYALFVVSNNGLKQTLLKEIYPASLYVYNISWTWGWGKTAELLGHTWSLAVEEQFYLVWPWIILWVMRKNATQLLLWILLAFIPISWYLSGTNMYPQLVKDVVRESIFIGCLGALLYRKGYLKKIPSFVAVLSLGIILVVGILACPPDCPIVSKGHIPFHLPLKFFNLAAVLSLLVIAGLLCHPQSLLHRLLSYQPMVFVGKISYALYLWHVPVFRWFADNKTLPGSVAFILKFVVTFICALISWYLIEKRATALGRRISNHILQKTSSHA